MSPPVATVVPRLPLGRTLGGAAWLLSGAMVVSGLLTYAFLILAARTLGPREYGRIGVLWGAMFIVAIVLFRPLEQTTSRAIADRRARGEEVRSVLRSVGGIAAVATMLVVAGVAIGWRPLADRLFGGDAFLMAMLVCGIALYGLSYVVRGVLGGAMWFDGYGVNLLADGAARLALALPLLLVASGNIAAVAVVGAGAAGALAPLVLGRRRLRPLLAEGNGSQFRLRRALAFATPASSIAAADQLLVNGAPLLVILGARGDASKTAGIVFAATMLVRAPVYVFQGLAAALLPNLTQLHATGGAAAVRRSVMPAARLLAAAGVAIVVATAVLGPTAMRILYGSAFTASRGSLTLLGLGVALYLIGATLSQALLALDAGPRAAAAWMLSACTMIVLYFLLPGGELVRVAASFASASAVLAAGLCVALATAERRR